MKKEALTDSELLELEMLVIEKFEKADLSEVFLKCENESVLIKDTSLKNIIKIYFRDRYQEDEENFTISLSLIKLLQSRYFRNNQSAIIS